MAKACVTTISRSIFDFAGLKFKKLKARYNAERFGPLEETAMASSEEEDEEEEEFEQSDEEGIVESIPVLLLQLECISLVLKLWLRRINLFRHSDEQQLNKLQDFEHAILIAQEKVIKPYKNFVMSNQDRDIKELLLEPMLHVYCELLEEELKNIETEMAKVNFEMPEEDRIRMNKETVHVCSYLGLKLDFLDRLEDMPRASQYHRTLCNWVVIFLRNNYTTLTGKPDSLDLSLSKYFLDGIGFDPLSSAAETILARSCKAERHIDPCEWAEIFIKDQFKYHLLLSEDNSKFPFQSDKRNEWLELPRTEFKLSHDDPLCHVSIANLVTTKAEMFPLTRYMLQRKFEDQRHTRLLFHGTDHESAVDILKGRGLYLLAGQHKRDFSSGMGFYLTNNFEDALNWANRKTVKPAMLVFRLNGDHDVFPRKLTLNGQQDLEKWREIVALFRSGKQLAKRKQILSEYDLIEGPVATVRRSETNGQLEYEPEPSSYQMCLISEDFADHFRQNLHSILFYYI